MNIEQVQQWLLSKLDAQIAKAKDAMDEVLWHLEKHDWKNASEAHRQIDYWLSRAKNTQRLLDEME
jgi:hypothetical protein